MAKQLEVRYQRSEPGLDKEEECKAAYADLLLLWAVAQAKRRGSRTLDESDFSNAHAELLRSSVVDWPRQIIGIVVILAAGGFASWGVSYFPNSPTIDKFLGGVLAVFAIGLGCVGGFIQFWPHWRK